MRTSRVLLFRFCLLLVLTAVLTPVQAIAQFDGARIYWPLPKNTNILGVTGIVGDANATLSNWEFAQAEASISTKLYFLSYTRVQPVLGRTAFWTLMLPAGHFAAGSIVEVPAPVGNSTVRVAGPSEFVHGVGDPSFSATVNLYGAPGLKAKEYARYDLSTTVGLQLKTSFPLGQYDEDAPASLGSNVFKSKFAVPITRALGDWVPGRRVALDLMPSLTLFTENGDYLGQRVQQDPTIAVEAHLSRDLTKRAFLSLDYTYLRSGGAAYTDSGTGTKVAETDAMDTHMLGVTTNFQINDNLLLFLTHMQTFGAEADPVVLEGAMFKATLSWSWHAVLQRARDFHE